MSSYNSVVVKNLPLSITEPTVFSVFESFGSITRIQLFLSSDDSVTARVVYKDPSCASSAHQAMNGSFIGGCTCATSLEHFEMDSIQLDSTRTLVIECLPITMTIHYLFTFFSSFGSVVGGYLDSIISPSGHRLCGYLQMATVQVALGAAKATNGRDFDGFHVVSSVMANLPLGSIPVSKDSTIGKKSPGYLVYVSGYPDHWKAQDIGDVFRQSCALTSVTMMNGYCEISVANETSLRTICAMCSGGAFIDPKTKEQITLLARPEGSVRSERSERSDRYGSENPRMDNSSAVEVREPQWPGEPVPNTGIRMPGMGKKPRSSMEHSNPSSYAEGKYGMNKNGKRKENKRWTKKENVMSAQQPSGEHRPSNEHQPSNEFRSSNQRRQSNSYQQVSERRSASERRPSHERRRSNDIKYSIDHHRAPERLRPSGHRHSNESTRGMPNERYGQSPYPSQSSYSQSAYSQPYQQPFTQPQLYRQGQSYQSQSAYSQPYQQPFTQPPLFMPSPQPYQQPPPSALYQSLPPYLPFSTQSFQPSFIQPSPQTITPSEAGLLVERLDHQFNDAMVKRLFKGFGQVTRIVFLDNYSAAVYFDMPSSADAAMRALRGKEINGNSLMICKLIQNGGLVIKVDPSGDFDDFARQTVLKNQIMHVNAILGLETDDLPVVLTTPQSEYRRSRPRQTPPAKPQPTQPQSAAPSASQGSSQAAPPVNQGPSKESDEQVLKVLEDQMAAVGTVSMEDLEGLSEEEKMSYLREFVAPIVGAVEKDQASEVVNEVLKMTIDCVVQAINDPKSMFETIAKAKKQM